MTTETLKDRGDQAPKGWLTFLKTLDGYIDGEVTAKDVMDAALQVEGTRATPSAEGLSEAVGVCLDGWIGQHEMGELWRDEVADMEALGRALVAYRASQPATHDGKGTTPDQGDNSRGKG